MIVKPPAGLSTASVYQTYSPGAPAGRIAQFLEAFRRGELREMGRQMHNRLQAAAGVSRRGLNAWRKSLLDLIFSDT